MRQKTPTATVVLLATYVAVVVAFSLVLLGTAQAAGPVDTNVTETPDRGEQISPDLAIVESEYDDGTAELTFRSDGAVAVTLTEATGGASSQVLERRTVVLEEGRTTVTLPVGEYRGMAAVTVSTKKVVWLEVIKVDEPLIGGPWSARDVQIAVAVAALMTALGAGLSLARYLRGDHEEGGRIA